MNILHINGLAAFVYRQRVGSKAKQANIITGSMSDKLAGLKVACDIAYKSSPCILYISLDKELSDHDDLEGMCYDSVMIYYL